MIYSMTGFGRAELQDQNKKISVEIKSVNHRYLDFNIRMPKRFNILDGYIRTRLKEYVKRGKVDVFINYESFSDGSIKLQYNQELASEYIKYAEKMSEEFDIPNDITVTSLLSLNDILIPESQEVDEKALQDELDAVLSSAGERFRNAKEAEGETLRKDLMAKLDAMKDSVRQIQELEPELVHAYKERLMEKMKEILEDTSIDESRIAAEVIIYADKISTDEETVRLASHIDSMKKELERGGTVGRKLDFLAQEMNREANTILSKSNDLKTSDIAIELKTGIEKIREQIQNIE